MFRKISRTLLILLVLLVAGMPALAGAQQGPIDQGPIFPGRTWQVLENPAEKGWIPARLEAARQRFLALGATGLMIVDDGLVVAEWGDTTRRVNCHSVRKSLLSALYGLEVTKGAIDLKATLKDLEISDQGGLTAEEQTARVEDLLQARSGVYHPANYESKSMKKKRPARGSHLPGTFWYYNNWDFNALGTIFRQKTGQDIFQAFYDAIAAPVGMQDFRPTDGTYHQGQASEHPAYLFFMSVRDRARFGLLYMRNGQWSGRQVVPKAWVEKSTTAFSQAGRGIGFGYMWWVSTGSYHLKNRVKGKAFSARGNWGQYIVVLPEYEIVVAMSSDKKGGARKVTNKPFGELLKMILRSNQGYLASLEDG